MTRAIAAALICALTLCAGSVWATEPKVTTTGTVGGATAYP